MRISASLVSHFALAGFGSLGFATLMPLPTVAAPGITLQGSFAADSSNGNSPYAALTSAGNGKFYGTTVGGGDNGSGAIFEFDPSGSGSITLKGSFDGANGNIPYAALTSAGNGKFYGTTANGGANDFGAIFEFDPSGSGSITLKGSFDGANGANPYAALTSAGNGKFYGTTLVGGDNGSGAIFEFDPSGNGSIALKGSFDVDGANGANPYAALTSAGNGKFYGTTAGGGDNAGAIFEFDPSGNGSITLKGSFDGANGNIPYAALTSAGNGKFYGTTANGGANDFGAIFEFDPSGSGSITLKGSFNGENGATPFAALTSAGNGKFYGTTNVGGDNGNGAIFDFDPGANNVPAPLPVIGAGAAFGWSRRLRRRIQQARPVFPMGR